MLGPEHADGVINQLATKDDISQLSLKFDDRFARVDDRFDRIEQRLDKMEDRFDRKLDKMTERLDAMVISSHEMMAKQWRTYTTILVTFMLAIIGMLRWIG